MAMKVMLSENIKTLGVMGDIVSVADGYARNYLLPNKMAVIPSDANLKLIEAAKKRRAAREIEMVAEFREMAARIGNIDITLKERVVAGEDKLYGAVSAKEIVAALKDESVNIEESMVKMDEPIKTLGVHRVKIKLHAEIEAEVKVWVVELKEIDGGAS